MTRSKALEAIGGGKAIMSVGEICKVLMGVKWVMGTNESVGTKGMMML